MATPHCDLIVLVWNHLDETRACVESLLRHTDVPSRLLLVDNGSETPTRDYLRSVRPAGQIVAVDVIRSETNEGYPRGMNRGLAASTAPYACLLNNDLLVTSGWLSELCRVAELLPAIGLVNPSSNTLGQRAAQGESLDAYAARLQAERGRWIEMATSIGFCMLIKRAVIERIGVLDPVFGMGSFEDNDYARRARAAGFVCVRAKGAYVYHHESRSMRDLWRRDAAEGRARFAENARVYQARWGMPERRAYVIAPGGRQEWLAGETHERANRDDSVWVYYPVTAVPSLPEHMNIAHHPVPALGFRWRTLWRVLKRKKKFTRIITNHTGLAWTLQQLHWLHRAQVETR